MIILKHHVTDGWERSDTTWGIEEGSEENQHITLFMRRCSDCSRTDSCVDCSHLLWRIIKLPHSCGEWHWPRTQATAESPPLCIKSLLVGNGSMLNCRWEQKLQDVHGHSSSPPLLHCWALWCSSNLPAKFQTSDRIFWKGWRLENAQNESARLLRTA